MQAAYEAPVTVTVTESRGGFWYELVTFMQSFASLGLRFALAVPFFLSGMTKWHGFMTLAPSTTWLFENQFQLHVFQSIYPIPYPVIVAWIAAFIEILAPAMLAIGFLTRVAALALFGMAAVIYLVYPANWAQEQLPWAAMALAIFAFGPGRISFDYLIWRAWRGPRWL